MAKLGERQVKIFATDVHRGSLDRANRGVYDREAIANVSPDRLEKYFLRVGDSYQVVPGLRRMVVFAAHNVIKDPPFAGIDLVTCRNLLIYLQPAAQQKALLLFHLALTRGGVMMLGPSESVGHLSHHFESIDKWQVYCKHTDVRMPVDTRLQTLPRAAPRVGAPSALPPAANRYSLS